MLPIEARAVIRHLLSEKTNGILDSSNPLYKTFTKNQDEIREHFANSGLDLVFDEYYGIVFTKNLEGDELPQLIIPRKIERIQDETGVELAFIGELIQVKQEEQRWRGAIERALGDKTTMLVKPEGYKAVTNYLNKNHLGLNVRVEKISDVKDVVVFEDTKFLTKLEWKESDYTPYLKHYLLARDLTCVETVEELNETPYSMTVEGLIHRRQGSFEKADRFRVNDRKMWQTGFSNKEKLDTLENELTISTDVEYNLNKKKQKLGQDLKNINAKIQLINSFDVDFDDINILPLRKQKKDLEDELKAINKDDLELIKSKIDETRVKAREKRDRLDKLNKQLGSLEWELNAKEQALNECADDAQKQVDETLYHFEFDFISSKDETVAKNHYKNELEKINKDLNKVNNDIVLIMGAISWCR